MSNAGRIVAAYTKYLGAESRHLMEQFHAAIDDDDRAETEVRKFMRATPDVIVKSIVELSPDEIAALEMRPGEVRRWP